MQAAGTCPSASSTSWATNTPGVWQRGSDHTHTATAPTPRTQDYPPFPTTLFEVDAAEGAETYASTAFGKVIMPLLILVSSRETLSGRGILRKSWWSL